MADAPLPLTPADCDLRDFAFTPLYRARLFGSSFHARTNDSEWRAGVTLWLKSWDQVPAGTLPDDDIDLCRLAELGRDLKAWSKVKQGAMRGWIKCSDGRLHHPVVAEGVLEAWERRQSAKRKGQAGASKRWASGNAQALIADSPANSTTNSPAIARAMPGDSNRQGQGQGEGTSLRSVSLPDPERQKPQPNGTRLPDAWTPGDEGAAYARSQGVDPMTEFEKFSDYWRAKPGKDGRKLDWHATWRTWCRNAAERQSRPPNHRKPSRAMEATAALAGLDLPFSQPPHDHPTFDAEPDEWRSTP